MPTLQETECIIVERTGLAETALGDELALPFRTTYTTEDGQIASCELPAGWHIERPGPQVQGGHVNCRLVDEGNTPVAKMVYSSLTGRFTIPPDWAAVPNAS